MRRFAGLAVLLVVLAASGCATTRKYNSLDLALLPCEQGNAPRFFRALEFDRDGKVVFIEQQEKLAGRLSGTTDQGAQIPVTDLVLFVHGWNKNPTSAEHDYQDFLCRLHAHLREVIREQKSSDELVVLGIFWPSTITEDDHDPVALKPISYFEIRKRADKIAESGLAALFESWIPIFQAASIKPRVQLVGHSFGARMLVHAMEKMQGDGRKVDAFVKSIDLVDVILLNAAIAPDRFQDLTNTITAATADKQNTPRASYLFNVHSFRDSATRYLFPLASVLDDDRATCAAGACGVPAYPTLCVTSRGDIAGKPNAERRAAPLKAWNVDATPVIFDHTDIYKGRIALLISTLMYEENEKDRFPANEVPDGEPEARCAALSSGP